jgi:hypothetical protein
MGKFKRFLSYLEGNLAEQHKGNRDHNAPDRFTRSVAVVQAQCRGASREQTDWTPPDPPFYPNQGIEEQTCNCGKP